MCVNNKVAQLDKDRKKIEHPLKENFCGTILSADSKDRITLYSIINITTGKYCSVAFI